jgi:hypothetical protein
MPTDDTLSVNPFNHESRESSAYIDVTGTQSMRIVGGELWLGSPQHRRDSGGKLSLREGLHKVIVSGRSNTVRSISSLRYVTILIGTLLELLRHA